MASPSPPSLHALTRGLKLLERISVSPGPLRFSDLREVLPRVGDSTLTRLLQGLVAADYLKRVEAEGYTIGPAFDAWRESFFAKGPDLSALAKLAVEDMARSTDESAGICILANDRLAVLESHTVPGAVSIIHPGETIHFEPDHAAALVVLTQLKPGKQKQLLAGPHSRIADSSELNDAMQAAQWHGDSCMDRSTQRPGICRIAKAFRHGDNQGAVFFCLTTERARKSLPVFIESLHAAVKRLEGNDS